MSRYIVLDENNEVFNIVMADEEFVAVVQENIDNPEFDTGDFSASQTFILADNEEITYGWKFIDNAWVEPEPIPVPEVDTTLDAENARIEELRAKVGPGKPGLTQDERDELNLILLSRNM